MNKAIFIIDIDSVGLKFILNEKHPLRLMISSEINLFIQIYNRLTSVAEVGIVKLTDFVDPLHRKKYGRPSLIAFAWNWISRGMI
jgi:hypothetical protein